MGDNQNPFHVLQQQTAPRNQFIQQLQQSGLNTAITTAKHLPPLQLNQLYQPPPPTYQKQRQIPVNVPSAKQILLTQKIQEKQQEYDNLLILKKTSQNLSDYFDQLAENIEELNNGCEAVATVLRNWQTVFRTILLPEETSVKDEDTTTTEQTHTHYIDEHYHHLTSTPDSMNLNRKDDDNDIRRVNKPNVPESQMPVVVRIPTKIAGASGK